MSVPIIQNAIYIVDVKLPLISQHRHDYIEYKIGEQKVMIDGGRDYLRSSGNIEQLEKDGKLLDCRLDLNCTLGQFKDRLMWPDVKDCKKAVFFKDMDTEKLESIRNGCGSLPLFIIETIDSIIKDRQPLDCKVNDQDCLATE